MPSNVVLHDRRLEGSSPVGRSISTLRLDGGISLVSAFTLIRTLKQLDGVQRLFVLCHGYAGENERGEVCGDFGGMGLQLGAEDVLHENVAWWRAIRGCVSTIVVYSCGAADTQPENRGSNADGKYLMGALAIHTNAPVYAADRIQWYDTNGVTDGTINFGNWEGTLWKFEPSGSFGPAPGNRVPVEVGMV
jgi:hypothetical protein